MGVKVREKVEGSGVWWIFINHNGQRKAKRVGTEKAAREAAKKIEAKLTLGDFKIEKPKPKAATFEEYAERWLTLRHDWKESTRHSYGVCLETHVYPVFGKTSLGAIGRKDLKVFFDGLLAKGKAAETAAVIKAAMNGVLTHAVESEVIDANPLREIRLKVKAKRLREEIDPLKDEEGEKLLAEAAKYQGGKYHAPMLCALRTGLRIGEIQALQWGDVDFNGCFLEVRRSWRQERLTDTKSKKRRRVDMTPLLAETLRVLQVEEKKCALRQGRPVSEGVFADEAGAMLDRETFRHALNKCLERARLRRIRVHDLRYSYASIRLNRGHNVDDVSQQLGHSSIKITFDVYGHLIPGKFKSEVDDLESPVQPAATQTQPETLSERFAQHIQ